MGMVNERQDQAQYSTSFADYAEDVSTAETTVFKVFLTGRGWRVTRNEQVVAHYPNQTIAEKAAARQARAEANKGNKARAIFYKRDGTVYSQRSYSRVTAPWLRPKVT